MKKILLSLFTSLLIFNTIYAEEEIINNIEENQEIESIQKIETIQENNTEVALEKQAVEPETKSKKTADEEFEYFWSAVQPKESTTSEGLELNWSYVGRIKDNYGSYHLFTLIYTIPENYEKDTLVINPDIFEVIAWSQVKDPEVGPTMVSIMPGMTLKVNVQIVNKSKYNYNYDENSFVIYPYSSEEQEKLGFKKITEDGILFNGEEATELQQYYRTENTALKALVKESTDKTLNDENIDKLLKEKGYSGIEELDKYFLDFYNKELRENKGLEKVEKLTDFTVNEIAKTIFGGNGTKYKETNKTLIALNFDFLFNYGFGVSLDDEKITDNNQNEYAPGEYMRNESKGDKKIQEKVGKLESNTEKDIDMNFHFSGPLLNNAYANYRMTGHTHLSYTAQKGNLIVRYIDTTGKELAQEDKYTQMVNKDYETIAREFEDYELIKVEGETTGKYKEEDTIVTYIYEFVGGTGGNDDVPNTGIDTNNTLEITTVLSLMALTSLIILRRRFN